MTPSPSTETAEEQALRTALARHASDVDWSPVLLPAPDRMPSRTRRGRPWVPIAVAAAVIAVVGGPVALSRQWAPEPNRRPIPTASDPTTEPAPAGWRWESYGGVQLLLPATWAWQDVDPWCVRADPSLPRVVRPGGASAVGCAEFAPVGQRGPEVRLGPRDPKLAAGTRDVDHGWKQTSVIRYGVMITAFDNDPARVRRILGSVRQVRTIDAHGCPITTPAVLDPAWRPHGAPLAAIDPAAVTSVIVCSFSLPYTSGPATGLPPLLASSRHTGAAATALVRALVAAPAGAGPDTPGQCSADTTLGSDLALVTVNTPERQSQVVVRYSGCTGHRMDDGHLTRRLTGPALTRVLAGPNTPTLGMSGTVGALLPRARQR